MRPKLSPVLLLLKLFLSQLSLHHGLQMRKCTGSSVLLSIKGFSKFPFHMAISNAVSPVKKLITQATMRGLVPKVCRVQSSTAITRCWNMSIDLLSSQLSAPQRSTSTVHHTSQSSFSVEHTLSSEDVGIASSYLAKLKALLNPLALMRLWTAFLYLS